MSFLSVDVLKDKQSTDNKVLKKTPSGGSGLFEVVRKNKGGVLRVHLLSPENG